MEKSEKQIKNLSFNARKKLKQLIVQEKLVEIKNNKIVRFLTLFIVISIFTSGIVFAKDITSFLKNIFGLHKGINSAIENNYIEKGNEKYIDSNDVKPQIDYALMDDYKLCISLKFELPLAYTIDNITGIEIPNILIYDENKNILFKHFFEEFDNSFLNISTLNESDTFGGAFSVDSTIENNNMYSITYVISAENSTFPKAKNIYVKFDKINCMNKNNISSDESSGLGYKEIKKKTTIASINGQWTLKLDLSEKSFSRENAIYSIKNYDKFDFDIPSELTVTQTETRFKLVHYYNDSKDFVNIDISKEPYIENENGEKFEIAISDVGVEEDKMTYEYWFELSSFDVTDSMKIIFALEDNTYMTLELEKI